MDRQTILDEVRRLAAENGGVPLGRDRFEVATGLKRNDWEGRYWIRWSDLIAEAGFEPNAMQAPFTDEHLLDAMARLVRDLGHYPVDSEIRMRRRSDARFPSPNTFDRFGGKRALLRHLLDHCRGRADLDDVAAIVVPLTVEAEAIEGEVEAPDATGFVYLLRHDRDYKIGRSNSVGRRSYEVALQLPRDVVEVHRIETDDPAGIEAYWHRRFADRRQNGEWFRLSVADVAAFKRRRQFM